MNKEINKILKKLTDVMEYHCPQCNIIVTSNLVPFVDKSMIDEAEQSITEIINRKKNDLAMRLTKVHEENEELKKVIKVMKETIYELKQNEKKRGFQL